MLGLLAMLAKWGGLDIEVCEEDVGLVDDEGGCGCRGNVKRVVQEETRRYCCPGSLEHEVDDIDWRMMDKVYKSILEISHPSARWQSVKHAPSVGM